MALSSSAWIFSLKVLFISVGIVSLAVAVKSSVPPIIDFALYEVPVIWSTLLSFLKPPYLYVVINGIIITIAASSRFHRNVDEETDSQNEPLASTIPSPPPSDFTAVSSAQPLEFAAVEESLSMSYESKTMVVDVNPVAMVNIGSESQVIAAEEDQEEDLFVVSSCNYSRPQRNTFLGTRTELHLPSTEKPLVSTRFGRRKPIKASPEGLKALRRVAKPKSHETLENTWKTMTDGRNVPLLRHLRKSDTWEDHGCQVGVSQLNQLSPQPGRKSETLKDPTNYDPAWSSSASPSPSSGKIRREPSPSQDELNRRVEAFIKKVNEEMRLQRQLSSNRHKRR